jgi:hypothetical protein
LARIFALAITAALIALTSPGYTAGTISLAVDNEPVKGVLAELTRQSGIVHRSVGPEADHQKLAVFCNDQPVEGVRQALAEALQWEWTAAERDRRKVYTFTKGLRLRDLERSLRRRELQSYVDVVRTAVAKASSPTASFDQGNALDLQAQAKATAGLIRALGALPADGIARLVAGEAMSGMPNAWPKDFVNHVDRWSRESGGTSDGHLRAGDILQLRVPRDGMGRPLWIEFRHRRGSFDLAEMRLALASWVRDESAERLDPDAAGLRKILEKHPEIGRPLKSLPDPVWPAPPAKPTYVGWRLRDISRRTDFPIAAAVYPEMEGTVQPLSLCKPPFDAPKVSSKSLTRALNDLGSHARYHWTVSSGWVVMRYRDWYWEPLRPTAK